MNELFKVKEIHMNEIIRLKKQINYLDLVIAGMAGAIAALIVSIILTLVAWITFPLTF